jgi:diguanylate cyclase
MLDIDHFKKINDQYGHTAGDEILKQLTELLHSTCRIFDIISRNGGEEFSVILQDTPLSHAKEVAERIRIAVESFDFKIDNQIINLTISIGCSSYPENTQNPDELISLADKALYQAKESGRNKVIVYH